MDNYLTFENKFWAKVDKLSPTECWNWLGAVQGSGYGHIKIPKTRKNLLAHRVSYQIHYGDLNDALIICHKCDNKLCTNPEHLFQGTFMENTQDAVTKGRMYRGEQCHQAKLTESEVRSIRYLRGLGAKFCHIASLYFVSPQTISDIIRKRTWGHI